MTVMPQIFKVQESLVYSKGTKGSHRQRARELKGQVSV